VVVIGGVLAIIWLRRTADCRGHAEAKFASAWISVAVWFGALPIIGAVDDAAHMPARLRDVAYALVLIGGLAVTVWFVAGGIRIRRSDFRELRRQYTDAGRRPPHYFWRPWAIFGWTLGLGTVLVIGGGVAVASVIGAMLDNATAEQVERTGQAIANLLVVCTFALLPISAAAGLWRWWQLRGEERQPATLAAAKNQAQPVAQTASKNRL